MLRFKVEDKSIRMTAEKTSVIEVASGAKIGYITLVADAWVGEQSPYAQVVSIPMIAKNTQVDITPSVEQLLIFYDKDLTFMTENKDGVVTVYAIGQKPTNDYTMQVTLTEVEYEGDIIGITVGTPISIEQIKERINPVISINGVEADNGNIELPNVMADEEVIKLQSALL